MKNPYPKIDHPDSELPCHICEGHREAWDEGDIHGDARGYNRAKAEQAEIVSGLLEALELAKEALTIKLNKPKYQEILEFKSKTEPIILGAIAKAKGE